MLEGVDAFYDVSNWAVLPEISGLQGGDVISFFAKGATDEQYSHAIQIRYSPSGGTDTGSSAADVGDFTELLFSIGDPADTWTLFAATVPGSGRLAAESGSSATASRSARPRSWAMRHLTSRFLRLRPVR